MLGLIVTDAAITPEDAQRLLFQATDLSFNCVSVDGHMSTNDTVLLLANGAAGEEPLTGNKLEALEAALMNTCDALAREIADDGEGATHVICIEITGAESREDARRVARAVADSPLVKTAIAGCRPELGPNCLCGRICGRFVRSWAAYLTCQRVRTLQKCLTSRF